MPNSSAVQQALAKGLAFALPLAALALGLELGLRRLPTAMAHKRAAFDARAPGIELLVLGASEGHQGLSPDLLGIPGFNLANVGQDLYYDLALFERLRSRLPKLKAVLLALSYPCLEYRLPLSLEHWRQFQYSQVWGLAPEAPTARYDLRRFSALALVEPWPALKEAWNGFKGEATGLQADGWMPLEDLGEEQLGLSINGLTARKRARYHDSLLDPARDAEGREWLDRLVRSVSASGARVLFVTLPVTEAYAQAADAARFERLRQAVAGAAKAIGSPYWDLARDARFDDADFADPDHLGRRGAEKLAKILAPQIKAAVPGL